MNGADASPPEPVRIRRAPVYEFFKRVLDLIVGIAILILLIPIIPAIAIMIRLDSPGSVFFRQERIGLGARPFKFYKFRSMYEGAERKKAEIEMLNEQEGPVFKMRADPRITPVGQFLRKSSLDEIPQVFNVLRGEMSLVGPRPPLPSEVERYEPWHRQRLEVKPGITGLWQVSGRSHIGFDDWMRLDIEYLRCRSWSTDLRILFKTIPAVIARKGAY